MAFASANQMDHFLNFEIPDPGEGGCVANCGDGGGGSNDDDDIDITVLEPLSEDLETIVSTDAEAISQIKEGDLIGAQISIAAANTLLSNTEDSFKNDDEFQEIRLARVKAVKKIDNLFTKAIEKHENAISLVADIIARSEDPARILRRLTKKLKRFVLGGKRYSGRTITAVAGVRG